MIIHSFRGSIVRSLALIVALFALAPQAAAVDLSPKVAELYADKGTVEVRRVSAAVWERAAKGTPFHVGDTLRTGTDGQAAVQFVDGTLVRLNRLSAITFQEVPETREPVVDQHSGQTHYFTRGARKEPLIRTPLVTAAIFGTELTVDVAADATRVSVLHGNVRLTNSTNSLDAHAGDAVLAKADGSLEKTLLVSSTDSVQWMIRVPFVPAAQDFAPDGDPACPLACLSKVRAALNALEHGRAVHSDIAALPTELRSMPRLKILEGLSLLFSGGVEQANALFEEARAADTARDRALASVMMGLSAYQRNDQRQAEENLERARTENATLLNVKLLASLVDQGRGRLEEALKQVRAARRSAPEQPELWDREAELLLSLDYSEDAKSLLTERNQRFGRSALSSTLLGFAHLNRKQRDEARYAFDHALSIDNSASLAYLGRGLVDVAEKDYITAKDAFSKAIQLEPLVSVYRSYLGKLFFESENSPESIEEYDAAISLDPNDPTPYLYRGFSHIAMNDPVAALGDIETSISLNDGRVVYRSRLRLDKDIGVRSAGLSRAFTELGFREAARIAAIRSLSSDYTNFSAHRMLSQSYSSIAEAEATISENRISDLLAPLSFNLLSSFGEEGSFGDYNALFDKRETRTFVSAGASTFRDNLRGEVISAGKSDDIGYLMSYRPTYANGTRQGRFLGDNTLRGALQYEPDPDVRGLLDATFQLRELEGAQPGEYSEDVHAGRVRAGGSVSFSPSTRLLVQGEFARDREVTTELVLRTGLESLSPDGEFSPVDLLVDESARQRVSRGSISTQLIHASQYFDSITGVEGLYADTSRREDSLGTVFDAPRPPGTIESSGAGNLSSAQIYQYFTFKAPRLAALTLGGAASQVEIDNREIAPFISSTDTKDALSPKIGLVLTPSDWLTVRSAYFEGLRKSVLEDLSSLEPTILGGINQRFTDLSGSQSRNMALGIDIKQSASWYFGAEGIHRHVTQPFTLAADLVAAGDVFVSEGALLGEPQESHLDVDILRGYTYKVFSPRWVGTFDAIATRSDVTDPALGETIFTRTGRFGTRYFFDNHWSALASARYRDQALKSEPDPSGAWLIDLGTQYRFAEQRGRIVLRVDNLFDQNLRYNEIGGLEEPFLRGRVFSLGFSYNF